MLAKNRDTKKGHCENYVRDFLIAAILPVSVIFVIIRHIAQASQWQPIVLIHATILAVSVMHSSSRVISKRKLRTRKHSLYPYSLMLASFEQANLFARTEKKAT